MLQQDKRVPIESYLTPAARLLFRADQRRKKQQVVAQGQDLLQWTVHNRKFLAADRPFEARPYLDAIYQDEAQEVVVCKAAQLGTSEYLVSWMLYMADIRMATGLYVFPNDTHVSDFSAARFGPAIEATVSPYLASIIVAGDARGADRVGLKRVRNRFVYFRGAKVGPDGRAPQLFSIDADALVMDEFDQMDPRAVPIARKRLSGSKIAAVRLVSTPTYPELGIHSEYLASDQRVWHISCNHCGKYTAPTLEHIVLEWDGLGRPTRWNGQAEDNPYLACPHCDGVLDRESGMGEWVAAYPDRKVHGYHMSRLGIAGRPLQMILDGLQEINETKRQQCYNQDIGLPYTPASSHSITNAVLDNCQRQYGHGVVPGETTYAGIDVGGVLHIVIRGTLREGQRPQRFAGTVQSPEEAARLLTQYNVKICVIDGLPEARMSRSLQAKFKNKVWLAYYADGGDGTKKEEIGTWNAKEGTVNVDRTRSLDETFSLFYPTPQREVENTLPANARYIPEYYAQLRASKRILRENSKGVNVPAYVESAADHYAHAENYCTVASTCPYGAGWSRGSAS